MFFTERYCLRHRKTSFFFPKTLRTATFVSVELLDSHLCLGSSAAPLKATQAEVHGYSVVMIVVMTCVKMEVLTASHIPIGSVSLHLSPLPMCLGLTGDSCPLFVVSAAVLHALCCFVCLFFIIVAIFS